MPVPCLRETAAELFVRNAERDDVAAHFEDRSWTWRELARGVAPPSGAVGRAARPTTGRRTSACCSTTRAEYLFWLGAAALDAVGDRRHQLDVPRRPARAADRPHRLPGARHLRRLRRPARRRAEPACPPTACSTPAADDYAQRARRGRRVDRPTQPADAGRPATCSSSRPDRPASRRRCAARRAASRARARTSQTVAELGPGDAVYAPLPFFHSSSLFTGLGERRCSAEVPFATPGAVLGVGHDARHPSHAARRCSPTPARS